MNNKEKRIYLLVGMILGWLLIIPLGDLIFSYGYASKITCAVVSMIFALAVAFYYYRK